MQRRLAHLFAVDVVGQSRLKGEDEEATLQTLGANRKVEASGIIVSSVKQIRQPWKWATLTAAMVLMIGAAAAGQEQEAVARGHSTNIEAREAFQKGWEQYSHFTPEDNAKAAEHFKRAVELDPDYGRAYSALGMVYLRGVRNCQWRWLEELGINNFRANAMANQYLVEGEKRDSSLTHVAASQIHLYYERHDKAFGEAARAVALAPDDPEAHNAMALAMITKGRPEVGLESVQTALRLNPDHQTHYVLAHAMAYFSMGDLKQAAAVLERALDREPGAVELVPLLASTYAHLGHRQYARAVLQQWRPDADETNLERISFAYHVPYPWARDQREIETRLHDGLYIAGLPLDVTIDSLIESLQQEDADVRKRAAMTLGRFGRGAVEAVPALIAALADEEKVAEMAVISLGKIGPAAEAAIPDLTALKDSRFVGHQAKEALRKIAGE